MRGRKNIINLIVVFSTGMATAIICNLLILDRLSVITGQAFVKLCDLIDSIPFCGDNTSGLIKALLTGEKGSLSRITSSYFRLSGASHVLALSGLHLGFIYIVIRRFCSVFGNSDTTRLVRYLSICGFCSLYTIMTGGSASIVRALLFIIIRESGEMFPGRKPTATTTLYSALAIQIGLCPSVAGTVGFQLSYAALTGITLFATPLQNFFPSGKLRGPLKRIWDNMCITISCQILTGPLCWLYFHSFPKYFLITNLIALPLTTALMAFAIFTIILSATGVNPGILTKVCDGTADLLVMLLRAISAL